MSSSVVYISNKNECMTYIFVLIIEDCRFNTLYWIPWKSHYQSTKRNTAYNVPCTSSNTLISKGSTKDSLQACRCWYFLVLVLVQNARERTRGFDHLIAYVTKFEWSSVYGSYIFAQCSATGCWHLALCDVLFQERGVAHPLSRRRG